MSNGEDAAMAMSLLGQILAEAGLMIATGTTKELIVVKSQNVQANLGVSPGLALAMSVKRRLERRQERQRVAQGQCWVYEQALFEGHLSDTVRRIKPEWDVVHIEFISPRQTVVVYRTALK